MPPKKQRKRNTKSKEDYYVDNDKLFEVMCEWKKEYNKTVKDKVDPPPVPEFVGECLILIANNLSTLPKFANYPFKDDMISESILNVLKYIHNFNPKKSKYVFAYFTQIMYWAFVNVIEGEKKQLYKKYKLFQDFSLHNDEIRDMKYGSDSSHEKMEEFVYKFETAQQKKKDKKTKKAKGSLDKIIKKDE